jgi:hypothetical protein
VSDLFFATLECELLERQRFPTKADARLAVFDFIEGWYNPRRRHSALDYLSPMLFERAPARWNRPVPSGSTIDPKCSRAYSYRFPARHVFDHGRPNWLTRVQREHFGATLPGKIPRAML